MPKIDELKVRMDWLKEAVKILVSVVIATIVIKINKTIIDIGDLP